MRILIAFVITISALCGALIFSRASIAGTPAAIQVEAPVTYPASVLELFTSQGCSSCPKANAFARTMVPDPNILVLSYSVDYWDYLGWKDTFGKPEFSERQRNYGKQFQGQVYTPQMVLNGAGHASSYSKRNVRRAVLPATRPNLHIRKTKSGLAISAQQSPDAVPFTIMAVRYKQGEQAISVAKGENKGRTIRLPNVVLSCKRILAGEFAALPAKGEAVAILIQAYKGGPILNAAIYTQ